MKKYVILGDSISEGIGSKKINYIDALEKMFRDPVSIVNMAKTGTTIEYATGIIKKIKIENPEYLIVMYGSVDAQIRANIWQNKYNLCNVIPQRYKIGGMLEPRSFFSHKWYRIIPDRVDNIIRYLIKRYVLFTQGTVQFVDINDFEIIYSKLIKDFSEMNIKLVLVSTMYLDDNYFLNSNIEYIKYNEKIYSLACHYNAKYVDVYNHFKQDVSINGWDNLYTLDHFHPNEKGYKHIAELIYEKINGF